MALLEKLADLRQCKADVVGENAGVEGMGVIPAVIGNIGFTILR